MDFPSYKMVIIHSFLYVYQRVPNLVLPQARRIPQALPEEFPDLGDVVRFLQLCHLFLLQLNQRGAGGVCRIARNITRVSGFKCWIYIYICVYIYICINIYIYTIYIDLSPTSWLFGDKPLTKPLTKPSTWASPICSVLEDLPNVTTKMTQFRRLM